MRGKLDVHGHVRARVRIIPAHAGQTYECAHEQRESADHPRACGANLIPFLVCERLHGSSPRMRGKPRREKRHQQPERIIPAHAGQTQGFREDFHDRTDHPRACGANLQRGCRSLAGHGSSPRMRGKRRRPPHHPAHARIIPAHAGQTSLRYGSDIVVPDHPRACGANRHMAGVPDVPVGSSPRMRGKRTV